MYKIMFGKGRIRYKNKQIIFFQNKWKTRFIVLFWGDDNVCVTQDIKTKKEFIEFLDHYVHSVLGWNIK